MTDHTPQNDNLDNDPSAGDSASFANAQLQKQLGDMEREKNDLFGRLQRVSADFQNYMRRAEQNTIDSAELARVDVLRRIVPIIDHFETALAQPATGDEARRLSDGFRIVRDEMMKMLQQAGVEFDPHCHAAMLQQPVEGIGPGRVAAPLQAGYRYRDRTIRPAKVSVTPAQ
jgi:molecular chaperone GrpE